MCCMYLYQIMRCGFEFFTANCHVIRLLMLLTSFYTWTDRENK